MDKVLASYLQTVLGTSCSSAMRLQITCTRKQLNGVNLSRFWTRKTSLSCRVIRGRIKNDVEGCWKPAQRITAFVLPRGQLHTGVRPGRRVRSIKYQAGPPGGGAKRRRLHAKQLSILQCLQYKLIIWSREPPQHWECAAGSGVQ